eukprot:3587790-Amphidinium_carterae.1
MDLNEEHGGLWAQGFSQQVGLSVGIQRTLPQSEQVCVQTSEDLQLRLWDFRTGFVEATAVRAGPNQLICVDVTDDGRYI